MKLEEKHWFFHLKTSQVWIPCFGVGLTIREACIVVVHHQVVILDGFNSPDHAREKKKENERKLEKNRSIAPV